QGSFFRAVCPMGTEESELLDLESGQRRRDRPLSYWPAFKIENRLLYTQRCPASAFLRKRSTTGGSVCNSLKPRSERATALIRPTATVLFRQPFNLDAFRVKSWPLNK